jgi:hypothetical protein
VQDSQFEKDFSHISKQQKKCDFSSRYESKKAAKKEGFEQPFLFTRFAP